VFENGASLFERDTRKPLHKLGNLSTVFKVLEQGDYGYARATEHPGSTNALRIPFDSRAGRPVNHEVHDTIGTF
jgi:hypothetical protein